MTRNSRLRDACDGCDGSGGALPTGLCPTAPQRHISPRVHKVPITYVTPVTLGADRVRVAPFAPTQRDRWSGGQRPVQHQPQMSLHPRPVGLWRLSACKTTSVTISILWTTSEVVKGSTALCHRAKLCVCPPCVFLGLFSFKERAHD